VGFWVLDEKTLRAVEAVEREGKAPAEPSALVLVSVYEAHGLYEDALAQVERLAKKNPTSPFVRAMQDNLRRQMGREQQ
jgi:hypothetical protein